MKQGPTTASDRNKKHANDQIARPSFASSGLVAIWTLYSLTIRQHLHGRRWLVMSVLLLLPAGLAILIRATATGVPSIVLEFLLPYMLIPQALLPIVALAYAAGIIQDEQEEQTLTYLLIRPIPRWAIYSVKLLATISTTVLLTTIFTALTFVAIYAGSHSTVEDVPIRCLKTIAVHDLTVIAYCCLFGLLSMLIRWVLLAGIMYMVVIEGLLANLPLGVRLITVIYYGRSIAYQSLPFKFTEDGRTVNLAADAWHFDPDSTAAMLSIPTCVAVLIFASLAFAGIGSMLCARREFHVKTPGGD
jgi:ABC-2 type transport system permease protein